MRGSDGVSRVERPCWRLDRSVARCRSAPRDGARQAPGRPDDRPDLLPLSLRSRHRGEAGSTSVRFHACGPGRSYLALRAWCSLPAAVASLRPRPRPRRSRPIAARFLLRRPSGVTRRRRVMPRAGPARPPTRCLPPAATRRTKASRAVSARSAVRSASASAGAGCAATTPAKPPVLRRPPPTRHAAPTRPGEHARTTGAARSRARARATPRARDGSASHRPAEAWLHLRFGGDRYIDGCPQGAVGDVIHRPAQRHPQAHPGRRVHVTGRVRRPARVSRRHLPARMQVGRRRTDAIL